MHGRIQKAKDVLVRQRWALAAAALGAVTFVLLYGVRVLDPTCTGWLFQGGADLEQHYLGWVFYRQSPLRLPYLGMSYNTIYPHRISVLYSDSLPLFAVLFKALSPLLPDRFQYFGLWGLLCFMMQGFWGQKCIARVGHTAGSTAKSAASLLGAQALELYPVLTVRMFNHTALAGNWLILAALYLWLRAADPDLTLRKACIWWAVMAALVVNIHMYYLPMTGIILVGFCVHRALLRRPPAHWLLPVPLFCGAGLFCLFLLGAFAGNMEAPAAGHLDGADFLGLVVPGLYRVWEFDLYIGAGLVLALAMAALTVLAAAVLRSRWLAALPAGAGRWACSGGVILLLTFAAGSSENVVFGGRLLYHIPLPAPLLQFWSMFAGCGRIGWVAGYLLTVLACGLLLRLWRPAAAAALLAICLAVQTNYRMPALKELAAAWHTEERYTAPAVLTDPGWQTVAAREELAHLQFLSYDVYSPTLFPLCAFAAQQHWTVNAFYLAHADVDLLNDTIAGQMAELRADTLYVFSDLNDLLWNKYPLHYYRLDGILIGTVDPLDLPGAILADPPVHTWVPADMLVPAEDSVITEEADGSVRIEVGSVSGPGCDLLPGTYEVTLEGSGFEQSYVHSGWHALNKPYNPLTILWLVDAPQGAGKRLVFRFTVEEKVPGWDFAIHALSDEPVTITGLSMKKLV